MTIAQYLPQWLRSRWRKPAPQKAPMLGKKDRQVLPTVKKAAPPPFQAEDELAQARFRIYWRM